MTVREAHAASYLRRLVHRHRARQIARGVAGQAWCCCALLAMVAH